MKIKNIIKLKKKKKVHMKKNSMFKISKKKNARSNFSK